jgi:RNA polymerase sigma-70 factor, ECF subfamily
MEFEHIMRENGPMIYTLAIRLTGNPSDGQDLAQETFIKAYKNFKSFRGDSAVGTWLYRICVNVWKNRVRYEKRRFFWRHFSFQGNHKDAPLPEPAANDPPLESNLEGSDLQETVQKALAQLDSEERAILVMRDMDDKSYEEISELLEIPMGTVKSRLARSRERLRQIVSAQGATI